MADGPMPPGLLGVGDPDVHVIDGVPTMFLGGFSTTFRNRLYVATLDEADDPAGSAWRVETDARGRARALAADPPRGAWDASGMHTPSYVPASDGQPARIYYTGRSSRKQYGSRSRYAIGMLEHLDGRWVRHDEPLVQGSPPRLSVLEPLVIHDGGRYVMWFQANEHEIGPGELPDYELRVTESADGITWDEPRVFASSVEGFFDNAVTRTPDGWLMVLARGADLHGTGGFPPQGLWLSTATELTTNRADWSEPRHVVRTEDPGTPAALARGTYGPGILHVAGPDRTILYATGVRATPRWPRFLLGRLLRGRRPVAPSPFYLSVAAIEL
ncbi:glycoside hydrolase family protein [Myceligenerans halotolerans]